MISNSHIETISKTILFITSCLIVLRPIFAPFPMHIMGMCWLFNITMLTIALYSKKSQPYSWLTIFLTFIAASTYLLILFFTGGLNSVGIVLLPIVPVFICMMVNPQVGWVVAIAVCIMVWVAALIPNDSFPAYHLTFGDSSNDTVKAVWLTLSVSLCISFSSLLVARNQKLSQVLHEQAHLDYLTGIANRRAIDNFLLSSSEHAREQNKNITVFMIDIDHFKRFNDCHGHGAGDECLRNIANAIKKVIRADIDMLGRYGGEEFIAVIPNNNETEVLNIAERIRLCVEALQYKYEPNDSSVVTVSIGVCTATSTNIPSELYRLIDAADELLYQAKHSGRNKVITGYFQEPSKQTATPDIKGNTTNAPILDAEIATPVGIK